MYDAFADPYCYAGTAVLKIRLGPRDQADLDAFEADAVQQRGEEPFPAGRLSVTHYRTILRQLFQDVYRWAGQFRSVRISKGGSMFCYPEHIPAETARIFARLRAEGYLKGRTAADFAAGAAEFLGEINAIHPFRDGNGRVQMAFMALVASEAGHPLALERIEPEPFLKAMIASFHGRMRELRNQLVLAISS